MFPGQFTPSLSHMFIKHLEESGQLLRNYTQNIDTLEKVAGIERVVECHGMESMRIRPMHNLLGSFARSTCLNCHNEIDSKEIRDDVMEKVCNSFKRN